MGRPSEHYIAYIISRSKSNIFSPTFKAFAAATAAAFFKRPRGPKMALTAVAVIPVPSDVLRQSRRPRSTGSPDRWTASDSDSPGRPSGHRRRGRTKEESKGDFRMARRSQVWM